MYSELTIGETFYYFGKLFRMAGPLISERESFLLRLLDLPSRHMRVEHLSGGQLRRVSFAICLLNQPTIMMLDEPTVGMDPLLRQTYASLTVFAVTFVTAANRRDCRGAQHLELPARLVTREEHHNHHHNALYRGGSQGPRRRFHAQGPYHRRGRARLAHAQIPAQCNSTWRHLASPTKPKHAPSILEIAASKVWVLEGSRQYSCFIARLISILCLRGVK